MGYYYYYIPNKSNTILYKIPLLKNEVEFKEDYINIINMKSLVTTRNTLYVPKLGYGISFVWEMYIPSLSSNDSWHNNFNNLKPIITMMDSPVISYQPKKNYLSIVVKYRDNPFYAQFGEIRIKDIKLQKWSKYIVVIDNRNISIYIDGNIVNTRLLPSVPALYDISSEITLGQIDNNFRGKLRNLTMYPYPLSYKDIKMV